MEPFRRRPVNGGRRVSFASRSARVTSDSEEENEFKNQPQSPQSTGDSNAANPPTPPTPAATTAATTAAPITATAATARPGIQPINTGINPAFGYQQTQTHSTIIQPHQAFHQQQGFPLLSTTPFGLSTYSQQPYLNQPNFFTNLIRPVNMADYPAPANTGGTNFQPQVPDTTNGPMLHHHVPRQDVLVGGMVGVPGGIPGGQVYYQQLPGQQVQYIQQPYQVAPGYMPVGYQQPIAVAGAPIANHTAPMMPIVAQPQAVAQPMIMPAQVPVAGVPGAFGGVGYPQVVPGNVGVHPEPATGIGRTPLEHTLDQIQFAHNNGLYQPQDFKPADDDVSRMYWVRELDNNWTQRNRYTIDNLGDCRWYVTDAGWFYAVRLPN